MNKLGIRRVVVHCQFWRLFHLFRDLHLLQPCCNKFPRKFGFLHSQEGGYCIIQKPYRCQGEGVLINLEVTFVFRNTVE